VVVVAVRYCPRNIVTIGFQQAGNNSPATTTTTTTED